MMRRRQENCAISCCILLERLVRSKDEDERKLLLDDLLWKSRYLQSDLGGYFKIQALRCFVADDISRRLDQKEPKVKTRDADVAIVTVKQPELLAAKVAFGIDVMKQEDEYANGLRFWESVLSTRDGKALNIALTMIGEAGTVSCAAACDRLFNTYDVDLCVLVGIAAGLRDKTNLGDVVVAEIILDYENARLEPSGAKKRPRQFSPIVALNRDVEYFDPKINGWYEMFFRHFEALKRIPHIQLPILNPEWKPNFLSGVVLSGDKLIVDGKMGDRREEFHDRIVAAEMEAVGFARLCEEHGIPWLVFRGVSDFGEPTKDDLWQVTSGLSVATAARIFLEKGYKKPDRAHNWRSTTAPDVKELHSGVDLESTGGGHRPAGQQKQPVRLFCSYSHKDEDLRKELEKHLKLLQRQGFIETWHDRKIEAGDEWMQRIDQELERADIILLLVSADFIASDYCSEKEMKRAIVRHENKEARVIPIIIRDVDWSMAPFAKLQALPKDGRAVMLWSDKDSAWRSVSEEIKKVVEGIQKMP